MGSSTITLQQLAKVLKFSPNTMRYHYAVGNLPKPIGGGRKVKRELFFNTVEVAAKLNIDNLDEPFLDLQDAAQLLDVDVQTVRSLVRDKYLPLPYFKMNYCHEGASLRFRVSEIKDYLKQRETMQLNFSNNNERCRSSYFKIKYVLEIFELCLAGVNLSPREMEVIRFLIVENKSLREAHEFFHITHERVRQVFVKTMAKIRAHLGKIKYDKNALPGRTVKEQVSIEEIQLLRQQVTELSQKLAEAGIKVIVPLPVDEIDLSIRARNCLRAAEIKDLNELEKWTERGLLRHENLGCKTLAELRNVMDGYGKKFANG